MDKPKLNRIFYSSEDYDEFATNLNKANIEEKLLESGNFKGYASSVLTPNIIVTNFKVNKKLLQIGTGAPGYITFLIWNPDVLFNWRNYNMTKGMIGILWKKEHHSVFGAGFNGFPISIKENYFIEMCQNRGYTILLDKLQKNETLKVSETYLNQIRILVKFVTQQAKLDENLINGLVEEKLIELLINCLLIAFPDKQHKLISRSKSAIIVDYIHENLSEITSVNHICKNTNVPERTVRWLINKKYDISPKSYINKLRLNEVRKILKNNTEKSNINKIASEYNFWHMGQFSRDYKKLFGELPSETIKTCT